MASSVEIFRQAILDDVTDTLMDKRNNLMAREQECHCRNNLDYALGQLRKSTDNTLTVFQSIEKYLLQKKCRHVWHRKRMDDASWDALPQQAQS